MMDMRSFLAWKKKMPEHSRLKYCTKGENKPSGSTSKDMGR